MSTMVGTSAEKERYETVNASKEGLINNDANQQIINATTETRSIGLGLLSYDEFLLPNVCYSYADKSYFLITFNPPLNETLILLISMMGEFFLLLLEVGI